VERGGGGATGAGLPEGFQPVFAAARVIRLAFRAGLAEVLARFVPATLLFRVTRLRTAQVCGQPN
jgi:hypothetical protein